MSVRFVAIDIEAYEHNHDLITEVGVAVLDTNKLVGVAPGETGKNWFSLIDAHHFRVKETTWAVNRQHVHGCPELFNFGFVATAMCLETYTDSLSETARLFHSPRFPRG
jgi:hypothetical protein